MAKMMETNERTVVLGPIDEGRMGHLIARQQDKDKFALNSIVDGVPKFIQETSYTTFLAEYVVQDGNIIIHFFLPSDFKGHAQQYWEVTFAVALDTTAQRVFQATTPRLQAKYTEEMKSWWFRALNYDHIIDMQGFINRFFDELDTALETTSAFARVGV